MALYNAGENKQAANVLSRISTTQRNDAVESLLGDIEEKQGNFIEAAAHLQAAAKINPSENNIYAWAVELLRHWSWQPASEVARYGIQQFPSSQRLQIANGVASFGDGKYAEAAAAFGSLLTLEPDSESYGGLLGRSCAALGGASAPQCASLVAFAQKHPRNAQASVYAAITLLHQSGAEPHDLNTAQQLLIQAIQTDPTLAEAYYQLGVVQQQRLQWNESAASLQKAIQLRPAFAEAHYRLSRAYSHTGRPDDAQKEIALQQRFSQQEKQENDAKLKEITTFLIAPN